MAITIVVEDGTGKPDANSYVSVAEVRQYASDRGIELPSDDEAVKAMIINATDYLESQHCNYAGRKKTAEQALEWPRSDVYFCNSDAPYPDNQIPPQLKKAQCVAVTLIAQGFNLMPNVTATDYVIEETVGPITTKYADPIKAGISQHFAALQTLLDQLKGGCQACFGGPLRTIRV